MLAFLGVVTCDKCGKPMERDNEVVIVAEGVIRAKGQADMLPLWASCIRYACHFGCWDGIEEAE